MAWESHIETVLTTADHRDVISKFVVALQILLRISFAQYGLEDR